MEIHHFPGEAEGRSSILRFLNATSHAGFRAFLRVPQDRISSSRLLSDSIPAELTWPPAEVDGAEQDCVEGIPEVDPYLKGVEGREG